MDDANSELRERSLEVMAEGFAFFEVGDFVKAEECFREAGEMRDNMPWREEAEAAWMRAAAWVNHGDAIMRAGDAGRFAEAMESMDKCIETMEGMVLEEHPAFVERLALAWMHRGTLCGETGDAEGAEDGFSKAEILLRKYGGEERMESRHLAGMLMVNRARMRLKVGLVKEAVADARVGVGILNGVADARAAVRARAVLCETLAALLDLPGGLDGVEDWIAEATDAVEEALAIVRKTGVKEAAAADLVRYGAKIYRVCQPVFLGEFLVEWLCGEGPLAGDSKLKAEMKGEILLAKVELERRVLGAPHETEFVEGQTRVLRKLQAGGEALDRG